jgi:hypothetical protein
MLAALLVLPLGFYLLAAPGASPGTDRAPTPATADQRGELPQPLATDVTLEASCASAAERLSGQMGGDCSVLVRTPFVIAGDLSEKELDRWHRQTVAPAAGAMASSYFRTPPDQPVSVLLFSRRESYQRYARQLFGDKDVSVYGYYKPGQRTLVMNISTGGGTLVHELTHALMDFDFPDVPDWFNEGLASLHEQCSFRPDGSGIDGLVNWRLKGLQRALAEGRLRPLRSLIRDDDFRGPNVGVNYAQARYFCLYMQQQGVLDEFYGRLRSTQRSDPLGERAVAAVFPDRTWDELEADFRRFVQDLKLEATE